MMNRFLDIIKGIGLASLVLTVCYFGCYRNIDSYSEWAVYEYARLTDNPDPVFYTRFDMDKVYDEYLEILNENQYFTPKGDYNTSFKYELRDEVRVSEHQSYLSKPKGKSIVFTGPFSRYATGALRLGEARFDLDGYVENIEYIIDKIDDIPDKTPGDYVFVSFLRIRFDYIYIAYEEDGSILRRIDLQEVLWRDND